MEPKGVGQIKAMVTHQEQMPLNREKEATTVRLDGELTRRVASMQTAVAEKLWNCTTALRQRHPAPPLPMPPQRPGRLVG